MSPVIRAPPPPYLRRQAKPLRLTEITQPLASEELQRSMTAALDRLLAAESTARAGGLAPVRAKLLAMMSAHFTPQLMDSEWRGMRGEGGGGSWKFG